MYKLTPCISEYCGISKHRIYPIAVSTNMGLRLPDITCTLGFNKLHKYILSLEILHPRTFRLLFTFQSFSVIDGFSERCSKFFGATSQGSQSELSLAQISCDQTNVWLNVKYLVDIKANQGRNWWALVQRLRLFSLWRRRLAQIRRGTRTRRPWNLISMRRRIDRANSRFL